MTLLKLKKKWSITVLYFSTYLEWAHIYLEKKIALDLIYFFKVANLASTLQMRNTQEKSDMLPEKANSSKNVLKRNSDIEPEQATLALKFLLLLLSAVAWKEISR